MNCIISLISYGYWKALAFHDVQYRTSVEKNSETTQRLRTSFVLICYDCIKVVCAAGVAICYPLNIYQAVA